MVDRVKISMKNFLGTLGEIGVCDLLIGGAGIAFCGIIQKFNNIMSKQQKPDYR